MKLYEISAEIEKLLAVADAEALHNDGVISDSVADELEKIEMEKSQKVLDVCRYIKGVEAEASAIAVEIATLSDRKKTLGNKVNWLKAYLSNTCNAYEQYSDPNTKFKFNRSKKVVITNTDEVPEKYVEIVEETKIDKREIRKDLNAGVEVPGCELRDNKTVNIK